MANAANLEHQEADQTKSSFNSLIESEKCVEHMSVVTLFYF